jgi:hypothetical protein
MRLSALKDFKNIVKAGATGAGAAGGLGMIGKLLEQHAEIKKEDVHTDAKKPQSFVAQVAERSFSSKSFW